MNRRLPLAELEAHSLRLQRSLPFGTPRGTRRVRWALTALGLMGCVSDVSPDAKNDVTAKNLPPTDAGSDGTGSTVRDARTAPSTTDANTSSNEGSSVTDSSAPMADTAVTPPASKSPCDLTGRWVMSERGRTVALGAEQLNVGWLYVEIEQTGDTATMTKTLYCGTATREAPGNPQVSIDDSPSWPAQQRFIKYDGRKGTSTETNGSCAVMFERAAIVKGATVATYSNESIPLPSVDQEASGSTPGWEDWDNDGHSGFTFSLSGLASGKMYTSARTFSSCSGTIAAGASNFKLDYNWNSDRVVYATDPNDPITRALLATDNQVSPKSGENYVEFGRLADGQATGNDDAICAAVRSLVSTLNPAANSQ